MPEMFNPYNGLTDEQIARVKKAGEIGMEKMKNENMPFPFALFDPDVLSALRGETMPDTVKRGQWIDSEIPEEKYVCSVCGGACWYYDYQGEVAKSKYCPNCGAKMRED